jgi:hypothetical protein
LASGAECASYADDAVSENPYIGSWKCDVIMAGGKELLTGTMSIGNAKEFA